MSKTEDVRLLPVLWKRLRRASAARASLARGETTAPLFFRKGETTVDTMLFFRNGEPIAKRVREWPKSSIGGAGGCGPEEC